MQFIDSGITRLLGKAQGGILIFYGFDKKADLPVGSVKKPYELNNQQNFKWD
jgi:hypothetical protein